MAGSSTYLGPSAISSIVPEEAEGHWEIRGFSYFNEGNGLSYRSKVLCEAAGASFHLNLLPGGHSDVQNEPVKTSSIYIGVTCPHNIWVSHSLAVIDKALKRMAQDNVLRLKLEVKAWPETPAEKEVDRVLAPTTIQQGALAKDLKALLQEGIATDVNLKVSGGSGQVTLSAHKLLLAARSPVFKKMYFDSGMQESAENAEVTVIDLEPTAVRWFLQYIYTDQIDPEVLDDDECLCHLLAVAHRYQVQPLLEQCECGIISKLSEDNACERLMMANLLGTTSLESAILRYIGSSRAHLARLQSSDSFARLAQQRPQLLVKILAQAVSPAPKRPATPEIPEDLCSLSVLALKRLLSDRGLATTGNKAALVSRLQESVHSTCCIQ